MPGALPEIPYSRYKKPETPLTDLIETERAKRRGKLTQHDHNMLGMREALIKKTMANRRSKKQKRHAGVAAVAGYRRAWWKTRRADRNRTGAEQ